MSMLTDFWLFSWTKKAIIQLFVATYAGGLPFRSQNHNKKFEFHRTIKQLINGKMDQNRNTTAAQFYRQLNWILMHLFFLHPFLLFKIDLSQSKLVFGFQIINIMKMHTFLGPMVIDYYPYLPILSRRLLGIYTHYQTPEGSINRNFGTVFGLTLYLCYTCKSILKNWFFFHLLYFWIALKFDSWYLQISFFFICFLCSFGPLNLASVFLCPVLNSLLLAEISTII